MTYRIYAYNIEWDITKEDLDNSWRTKQELEELLPFDMSFRLAIGDDEDDYDAIADHLFDMVGWMPAHFEYSKREIDKVFETCNGVCEECKNHCYTMQKIEEKLKEIEKENNK